jgi:hypothetical protein
LKHEPTVGIQSTNLRDLGDPTCLVSSFDEDNDVNRLGDQIGLRRHVGALREAIQAVQRALGRRRVHCGNSAGVAGRPRVEEIQCFGAANLADDDSARAGSECAP